MAPRFIVGVERAVGALSLALFGFIAGCGGNNGSTADNNGGGGGNEASNDTRTNFRISGFGTYVEIINRSSYSKERRAFCFLLHKAMIIDRVSLFGVDTIFKICYLI